MSTNSVAERSSDGEDYNGLARKGVKTMLVRQIAMQVLTFAGGVVLARTLSPATFGIFGIATFFIASVQLFGDFGLVPSLVQRKQELSDRDLQVAFTLQQVLLTAIAAIMWFFAPAIAAVYPGVADEELVWLVRVLAFTLFLQSWRSMSVLQLERRLDFKRVAPIEIAETLSYQCLAVGLAVGGFGVWSLVWATLARGMVGVVLAYCYCPWQVRLTWDSAIATSILRFGLPFQFSAILNSLGNWVTPLLVGTLIGPAGVGLILWASSNAQKPQWAFDSIVRVAFPHFSRLQGNPVGLARVFERYLLPPFLFCGLWLVGLFTAAPDLVPLIYGEQWTPSITLLKLFGAMMALNMLAWFGGTMLRSIGFVGQAAIATGANSIVTIITTMSLISLLGIAAVPVGMIFGVLLMTLLQWRILDGRIVVIGLTALARVAIAFTVGAGVGTLVRQHIEQTLLSGLSAGSAGSVAFLITAWFVAPDWLRQEVRGRIRRRLEASQRWLGRTSGVSKILDTPS